MSIFFTLPNCYIVFNAKAGSSSVARMILRDYYPDIETHNKITCQNLCPKTTIPDNDKPILLLVRDPISRFKSVIAQFYGVNIDSILYNLVTGGFVDYTTSYDNRHIQMYPQNNIHFAKQCKVFMSNSAPNSVVKLYKFPDHLENLIIDAGLSLPIIDINKSRHEKPILTPEQESKVLDYYASDKLLFDSIKEPGQIYVATSLSQP